MFTLILGILIGIIIHKWLWPWLWRELTEKTVPAPIYSKEQLAPPEYWRSRWQPTPDPYDMRGEPSHDKKVQRRGPIITGRTKREQPVVNNQPALTETKLDPAEFLSKVGKTRKEYYAAMQKQHGIGPELAEIMYSKIASK